jgi:hypothetical protein
MADDILSEYTLFAQSYIVQAVSTLLLFFSITRRNLPKKVGETTTGFQLAAGAEG